MRMETEETKFAFTWEVRKRAWERCSGIANKGGFPIVLQLFVLSWTAQSGLHFYSAGLKAWISQRLPVKKKRDILSVQYNALVANTVSRYFFHGGQLLCIYKSSMTWSSAVTGPCQTPTAASADTFQPKNRKVQRIRTSPHHPTLYVLSNLTSVSREDCYGNTFSIHLTIEKCVSTSNRTLTQYCSHVSETILIWGLKNP